MAAITEHTWRWAATSCTRTIRHPRAAPRAAAASDASRRWVEVEAEHDAEEGLVGGGEEEGIAEIGQPVRGTEQGE